MPNVRPIGSIRAKRKRYRQKKKDKLKAKEQWEIRIKEDLCARWRDRRTNYEKEEKLSKDNEQAVEEKLVKQKEIDRKCQKEIMDCQADLYDHEASKTTNAMGALLLPTVQVPDQDHETSQQIHAKLSISKLSRVDSVSVVSYI